MNEKILNQMCEVLDKYHKDYSIHGVRSNLASWQKNKSWLVDLLRKHPNWDEESLAIVFEVSQSRAINPYCVNEHQGHLCEIITMSGLSQDRIKRGNDGIEAALYGCPKTIADESTAILVKQKSGVPCVIGQKPAGLSTPSANNTALTNFLSTTPCSLSWPIP